MEDKIRNVLIALHVMCGLVIVILCYTLFRLELSAEQMEDGDRHWQAMSNVIANLALGSWSLLVLTAIIVAAKRLLPMSEGLKRLVYALLTPPFYFWVARIIVAEWYFTFVSDETKSAFFR